MTHQRFRAALALAFFIGAFLAPRAAVVYQYGFENLPGNNVTTTSPWTGTPDVLATGLSASSWATSYTGGLFISYAGSCGTTACQALSISHNNYPSSTTYTLTFTINAGYTLSVTDLSFWNRQSTDGPHTANITINGTAAVNNLTLAGTTGANTGVLTPVNSFTNLSGTFTLVMTLSGATAAAGTFRLDDFVIDGTVTNTNGLNAYNVTGGGGYCIGANGVAIGLAGSDTGVTYQLKNSSNANVGLPVAGTGSAISFGPQTVAGTYTVLATKNSNSTTATMTGSATIIINQLPVVSLNTPPAQCGGSATLDAGNAGSTFLWSDNSTTETINAATTGTYTVTVTNTNTCSASASVLVTINTPPSISFSITNANICAGTPTTITANGATSYLWSNSATTGSITVSPANTSTYNVTGTDQNNCTATGASTVNVSAAVTGTVTTQICQGLSYYGHTASGTYLDTFSISGGCDSIRTLNLTVLSVSNVINNQTICAGQSYGGHSASGTYADTLSSVGGCDSILTLVLTVQPALGQTFSQSICNGQSYQGHTAAGTYYDTLSSVNGCDSIITLQLTMSSSVTSQITSSICTGQNYDGHTTNGTFIDTLSSSGGCDSIRTLNLTVYPAVNGSTTTQTICNGTSYNGHTVPGNYSDTLSSVHGCDSVVALTLIVLPQPSIAITRSICQRDTFMGHTTSGNYADTLLASNGCDSIIYLQLTVNPLPHVTLYLTFDTVCNNSATIIMSGGSPAGGYYSGQGIVNDSLFVPSVAPIGYDSLVYTFTDSNGCTKHRYEFAYTEECDSTLGINEATNNLFKIMPNPAHDYLTIESSGTGCNGVVNLYNMLGQLLLSQPVTMEGLMSKTVINLNELPAGVYLLNIVEGATKVYNNRIVKD